MELSTHAGTDPAVLVRTRALMEGIGKLPVVCGPTPGYIVPRLQALIMNEAARMIEEGAATAEEIDKATRYGLGLRFAAIGVVEFIDFGGTDILHHASREMSASSTAIATRAGHRRPHGGARPPRREDRQRLLRVRRAATSRRTGATCWRAPSAMLRHAGLWRPPHRQYGRHAMKAARGPCLGRGAAHRRIEAPVATPGRTIVEMQAATVGRIDRTVWSGDFFSIRRCPLVPGVGAAGIVRSSQRFCVAIGCGCAAPAWAFATTAPGAGR